jgi:hypothetical protein
MLEGTGKAGKWCSRWHGPQCGPHTRCVRAHSLCRQKVSFLYCTAIAVSSALALSGTRYVPLYQELPARQVRSLEHVADSHVAHARQGGNLDGGATLDAKSRQHRLQASILWPPPIGGHAHKEARVFFSLGNTQANDNALNEFTMDCATIS